MITIMAVMMIIKTYKFRTRSARIKHRSNFNISIVVFFFISILSKLSINETIIITEFFFNSTVDYCVKSVLVRSFSGPNAGKYGPEKIRIRALLTQCTAAAKTYSVVKYLPSD